MECSNLITEGTICPRCGKNVKMIYGRMGLCAQCKKEIDDIRREGYRDAYLMRLQKERGKEV